MNKIIISNNAVALEAALTAAVADGGQTATVEAEYGDACVAGTLATLAHHGPRKGQPCPCLRQWVEPGSEAEAKGWPTPLPAYAVIGVSHIDLDTLGGIMALVGSPSKERWGRRATADGFWAVAALIDVRGPHRLQMCLDEGVTFEAFDGNQGCGVSLGGLRREAAKITRQLQAFWAWSAAHRIQAPRDGSVADITVEVAGAIAALELLLDGDESLLTAGDAWAAAKETLDANSYIGSSEGVILRVSDGFVNHLYRDALAVVALNTKFNSVTISLADPIPGVSCREIVQDLWGPEAGGHDGIAGSPRGKVMTKADADAAFYAVQAALRDK